MNRRQTHKAKVGYLEGFKVSAKQKMRSQGRKVNSHSQYQKWKGKHKSAVTDLIKKMSGFDEQASCDKRHIPDEMD